MTLLVGIGNTLRRDDGAGVLVVSQLPDRPGVRKLVVHQLLPEHAVVLADCDRVVFVDVAVDADAVRVRPLLPTDAPPSLGHTGDATWLLGLCKQLYGRVPETILVTIPANDLGFGDGLSEDTSRAAVEAVGMLSDWLSKSVAAVPPPAWG